MGLAFKRIAISQRYDPVPGRNEWRDSLDTKWAAMLCELSIVPILIPNSLDDVERYLDEFEIEGLILTGGNDIGSVAPRDETESVALAYADKRRIPVLGVCRGMQFLSSCEGGSLYPCEGHVGKCHNLIGDWAEQNSLAEVNSYHDLAILQRDCPDSFEILATTVDGVVEAFRHKDKPWLGIMWHPERMMPFALSDLNLIKQHFGF